MPSSSTPVEAGSSRHHGEPAGWISSSWTSFTDFCRRFWFGPGGAATIAGTCEILLFHPFDTVAKRLMSHRHRVVDPHSLRATGRNFYDVVFGSLEMKLTEAAAARATARGGTAESGAAVLVQRSTLLQKLRHLYPGSRYAVMYKVSQRVMKFAGQPMARDYMYQHHAHWFFASSSTVKSSSVRSSTDAVRATNLLHTGSGALLLESFAGCFVGVSETVLLPFDRMKVLKQTNKDAVQHHGLVRAFLDYGPRKLYAGAMTTATRNAVGSFFLFGGTAFTKEYVFHLQGNYRNATFFQNVCASTVGGVLGVLATSPMDVIKTRIQGQSWHESSSGQRIFWETCQKEGFSAFYKGITPKILTSTPKLVFGYTMTQYFLKFLKPSLEERAAANKQH